MVKHEDRKDVNLVLPQIFNLTWNQIQPKNMSRISAKKRKLYESEQPNHGFLLNNFMALLQLIVLRKING